MIKVSHISKTFENTKAVDDISFTVEKGEIIGLLGPNGAGKTTTMRIISNYYEPDSGSVFVDGNIGYLPENNPLYPDMLVSEHFELSGRLYGLSHGKLRNAIEYVVEAVDLRDYYYRPTKELSKGYKQRVGMALALLHNPDVLILDEPSEGLDPNQRTSLRNLITTLGEDRTIILSTHVLQEVSAVCNRILIINHGELVADKPTKELLAAQGEKRVVNLTLEGINIPTIINNHSHLDLVSHASEANVHTLSISLGNDGDISVLLSELIHQHEWIIRHYNHETRSLEDIFSMITSETN